jgi:hypothetical protein
MKIQELTARNTTSDVVEPVRLALQELNIRSVEFRDPFSIITTLSCSYEKLNGLNHLLVFVGTQGAETYLQIYDYYVELHNFGELSGLITDKFVGFDKYVESVLSADQTRLCKSSSISHFVSNGFRFSDNKFEHVFLVYIEELGVFKFESNELQEFKEFIDKNMSYLMDD